MGSSASASGPETGRAEGETLRANELNLFDETVVAISSVGPTYSLAATAGLLFVAVAYAGPAAISVSFIPMLFIALAYFYLNRRDPNCGWFGTSAGCFMTAILLPFLAGLFCFWVGYEVIKQSGLAASADVLVVLALGIPLVWGAQRFSRGDFFKQRPIAYASIE